MKYKYAAKNSKTSYLGLFLINKSLHPQQQKIGITEYTFQFSKVF